MNDEHRQSGDLQAQSFLRSVPALALIGLLGLTVHLVLSTNPRPGPYAAGVLVILLAVAGSVWARHASHALGILMLNLGVITVCAVAGLGTQYTAWWAFLLLPTVLTGGFVSLRGAVAASVASFVTVVGVLITRGAGPAEVVTLLSFHLVVPPLWVFVAYQRDRVESLRRTEIAANNERLNRAEELAGVGHLEVTDEAVTLSPSAQTNFVAPSTLRRAEFDRLLVDAGEEFRDFLSACDRPAAVVLQYRRDDEIRSALMTRSALPGPQVLCTVQDITQQRAASAERHAMEQRLLETAGLEAIGALVSESAETFEALLMKLRGALDGIGECSEAELEERSRALLAAIAEGTVMTSRLLEASRAQRDASPA